MLLDSHSSRICWHQWTDDYRSPKEKIRISVICVDSWYWWHNLVWDKKLRMQTRDSWTNCLSNFLINLWFYQILCNFKICWQLYIVLNPGDQIILTQGNRINAWFLNENISTYSRIKLMHIKVIIILTCTSVHFVFNC